MNGETQHDAIEQPAHYTRGDVQPIQFIFAQGWGPAHCAACVVKYVARYKDKNGVEDLKKARRYLDWMIEHAETGGITI